MRVRSVMKLIMELVMGPVLESVSTCHEVSKITQLS